MSQYVAVIQHQMIIRIKQIYDDKLKYTLYGHNLGLTILMKQEFSTIRHVSQIDPLEVKYVQISWG